VALGLSYEPAEQFLAYITTTKTVRVPPAPTTIAVNAINLADKQVIRAAIHNKARLLTGDAPLISECQKENVEAGFPWTIVTEAAATPPVDEVLRMAPPRRRTGTFFARTTPGGWKGMNAVGTFTVVDVENVGTLAFETNSAEWVFSCANGVTARMKYAPAGQGTAVVCVSYNLPPGKGGKIVLRAARLGSDDGQAHSATTFKSLANEPGKIQVGATLAGTGHWNGYIRHLTTGPENISSDTWRAIAAIENAAPNPMNQDILDKALLTMQVAFTP
jgi:hypothetical protein